MIFIFLFFIFLLIYIEYKRTNILFSYYNLFLLYWFLYTSGIYLAGIEINKSYTFSTLLIVAAGLFFIVGYNILPLGTKKFKQSKIIKNFRIPNLLFVLILLFIIALSFAFYVIVFKIGFYNYFFTSRANRSLMVRPFSHFMIFIDLFNILSGLSLFLYFKTNKKIYICMFLVVFLLSITHAVMTISRNDLVLLVVPIIYLLHYFDKLKAKSIIILTLFGFLIGALWKSLLYVLLIGSFHGGTTIELKVPREFIVWREIGKNILDKDISLNGSSYIDALINFIYPFKYADNLSLWYVKTYEPHTFAIGGGRGFSNILEAYINFGFLGVVLFFFIFGIIIYIFQLKSQKKIYLFLPYMYSLAFIHRIFRADFMSLTKTWWWMYCVSFGLLFLSFRLIRKEKK